MTCARASNSPRYQAKRNHRGPPGIDCGRRWPAPAIWANGCKSSPARSPWGRRPILRLRKSTGAQVRQGPHPKPAAPGTEPRSDPDGQDPRTEAHQPLSALHIAGWYADGRACPGSGGRHSWNGQGRRRLVDAQSWGALADAAHSTRLRVSATTCSSCRRSTMISLPSKFWFRFSRTCQCTHSPSTGVSDAPHNEQPDMQATIARFRECPRYRRPKDAQSRCAGEQSPFRCRIKAIGESRLHERHHPFQEFTTRGQHMLPFERVTTRLVHMPGL